MLSAITAVFDEIGVWIQESVASMTTMFYSGEQLTFLGILAVCGLAFSVIFLIIGIIQNFLHLRG